MPKTSGVPSGLAKRYHDYRGLIPGLAPGAFVEGRLVVLGGVTEDTSAEGLGASRGIEFTIAA